MKTRLDLNGVRTEAWTEPRGLARKELLSVVLQIKIYSNSLFPFTKNTHTHIHMGPGLRVVFAFGALYLILTQILTRCSAGKHIPLCLCSANTSLACSLDGSCGFRCLSLGAIRTRPGLRVLGKSRWM